MRLRSIEFSFYDSVPGHRELLIQIETTGPRGVEYHTVRRLIGESDAVSVLDWVFSECLREIKWLEAAGITWQEMPDG